MKIKFNASPLQMVYGVETIVVECVFDGLSVRKCDRDGYWYIYCPHWWEYLFDKQFDTSEEAVNFIKMRCEEYINEVLEWVEL